MASNYDEKILSSFGKRDKKSINPSEPDEKVNGIFVVDPNRLVDSENAIKPRYVKQEDLVMYANITARLNPDSSIIDNDGANQETITIGKVGVNFLNPLQTSKKGPNGDINFDGFKNKFTTGWSEYFTSNENKDSFYDPETFGISNIDVTHNASLVPIIKVEFIDVQGRTLLERGDDDTNPYNIFYRFPYPIFTLTIKGYYGKAIEYPLSMTKTSTTFDSTSGNYVIKAEFLSRTFSVYNNFLMAYAQVAPYMYLKNGTNNDYLGKRILKGLYQKQNKNYEKLYGKDSLEYKKYEFTKYPSIQDLSRAKDALDYNSLSLANELSVIKENSIKSTSLSLALSEQFSYLRIKDIESGDYGGNTEEYTIKPNTEDNESPLFYLRLDFINEIIGGGDTLHTIYDLNGIFSEIYNYIQAISSIENDLDQEVKESILDKVLKNENAIFPSKYINEVTQRKNGTDSLGYTLINDELFGYNLTTTKTEESLRKVYYTFKHFKELHNLLTKTLNEFYQKLETTKVDNFTLNLKEKIGYVPNMSNVIRILMNNMQAFLSMLNLVGLNSAKQLEDDYYRRELQNKFGETINGGYYPFPNFYEKKYNTETEDTLIQKRYPGNTDTKEWFEVQFVEEIFRALDRLKEISGMDSDSLDSYEYKDSIPKVTNVESDRKFGLLSTLLVENNLDYYNIKQTGSESYYEMFQKITMFSNLGFLNTNVSDVDIDGISKIMVDHEYDLIERRVAIASKESREQYLNDIYSINDADSEEGYKYFCKIRVTKRGNNNNYIGIINQSNEHIKAIKESIKPYTTYDTEEIRTLYNKIEGRIGEAVNLNEFKRLYDYEPLNYKNLKSSSGLSGINSLFFKGLDYHDEYEGYSVSLNKLNDKLKNSVSKVTPLGYYRDQPKKYPKFFEVTGNYTINNKVASNDKNSNALALSIKTDNMLGLDQSKKNNSGVRYSKINL